MSSFLAIADFLQPQSLELGSTFIYGVRISFESFSGVHQDAFTQTKNSLLDLGVAEPRKGGAVEEQTQNLEEAVRILCPGTPVAPPAAEEVQHFMDVCHRYDYWVAPHEENAAVGISLF